MSRTKSKQPQPLRYSGPELTVLLDEVAARHGADVSIAAVNRIRTGGIAGFFCKEEFEILVDAPLERPAMALPGAASGPASARPVGSASAPTIVAARAAAVADGLDLTSNEPARRAAALAGPSVRSGRPESIAPSPPRVPEPPLAPEPPRPPGSPMGSAPSLTRTATIAVPFDPEIDPEPVVAPEPEPVPLGGPQAPTSFAQGSAPFDRSHHGDTAVDNGAVDDDVAVGAVAHDAEARSLRAQAVQAASIDAARSTEPIPVIPGRATPLAPAPASSAVAVRRMADATPIAPAIEAAMLLTEEQARTSPFWLELYRTQRELASFMPLPSPFVAVVGTLPQAMTVTRRLRQGPTMSDADVYVLTDRAGIVSEPMWNLVRSGRRLLEIASQRAESPTVFIVDVPDEHPNWLFPLQNRLRIAGVSLFHYVVNGRPTAQEMERFRQGTDLPYAVDLVARLEPEKVLELIEHRHPVASVSGTVLTAEFLVAMRRQVSSGRELR